MYVLSFAACGLAIACSHASTHTNEEIHKLLLELSTLFLFGLSIIYATVGIKLLILVALLLTTKQTSNKLG